MSRPLRIEFPGALYHLTSRGDRREPIYLDDADRLAWLEVLAQVCERFDACVLSYCLMGNHYHVVMHTRQPNLSALMRHLNGVYTQRFNRRHGKVGHVFQGRFKAILVDRDSYLLTLCRYVELNPVRAGVVPLPGEWPWSSYRAHTGACEPPPWLDTPSVHGFVLGRTVHHAGDAAEAARCYTSLVLSAPDLQIWPEGLRQQVFLGDERFVARMQALTSDAVVHQGEIPRAQRSRAKPLDEWMAQAASRPQGLWLAHTQGGWTMTAMAQQLGLSVSRVSRLVKSARPRLAGRA